MRGDWDDGYYIPAWLEGIFNACNVGACIAGAVIWALLALGVVSR